MRVNPCGTPPDLVWFPPSPLPALPAELWQMIATHLNDDDLVSCAHAMRGVFEYSIKKRFQNWITTAVAPQLRTLSSDEWSINDAYLDIPKWIERLIAPKTEYAERVARTVDKCRRALFDRLLQTIEAQPTLTPFISADNSHCLSHIILGLKLSFAEAQTRFFIPIREKLPRPLYEMLTTLCLQEMLCQKPTPSLCAAAKAHIAALATLPSFYEEEVEFHTARLAWAVAKAGDLPTAADIYFDLRRGAPPEEIELEPKLIGLGALAMAAPKALVEKSLEKPSENLQKIDTLCRRISPDGWLGAMKTWEEQDYTIGSAPFAI